MWWTTPKRDVLRKWETRGDTFFVTMWNGDHYQIQKGNYEAIYEKNSTTGLRSLQIKLPDRKKKLYIMEMVPMFPNGKKDFDALIEEVGAPEGMLSKMRWIVDLLDIFSKYFLL